MQTTLATIRPLIGLLAVVAVLAGACSADSTDDTDTASVAPAETSRPSVDPEFEPSVEGGGAPSADDGWIDGEPGWYDSSASDEAPAEYEAMADEAAEMTVAVTAAPAATTMIGTEDVVYESEQPQTTLTGGSIDDNERFEDYLAYRADFFGLGIPVRDLDPTGRIVVTVTGENGFPAAGAEVVVRGDGVELSLRSTADGTVRFHPEAHAAGAGPFTVSAGRATTVAERGHSVALETSLPTAAGETVALDVLFLLDATGSMEDEIHQLKITIDEVAQRIHRLPGDVDVRLGMTLYRDEFDSFLTSTFDLTPDVEAFAEALSAVVADGGDDYPEALDEAACRCPVPTVVAVRLRHGPVGLPSSRRTPTGAAAGAGALHRLDARSSPTRYQDLPGVVVGHRRPGRVRVPPTRPVHRCPLRVPDLRRRRPRHRRLQRHQRTRLRGTVPRRLDSAPGSPRN